MLNALLLYWLKYYFELILPKSRQVELGLAAQSERKVLALFGLETRDLPAAGGQSGSETQHGPKLR